MPDLRTSVLGTSPFTPTASSRLETFAINQLRTELADLASDLERQGRRDAADVVMQVDARLRGLAEATPAEPTDRTYFP